MAVTAPGSSTFTCTPRSDREIVITRVFDAPRRLVFDAMTKPEHIRKWWGILDDQHSVVVCDVDFRVGGTWRYVGRGPRGEYAFHGTYLEIDAPGRVVFTEIFEPHEDNPSVVTSVLTEEGRKTRFTATCVYPSREVRDMVIGTGMAKGAAISYDRLEEVARSLEQ